MTRLKIWFWKSVAKLLDLRPRMHLPTYSDYPIASTPIDEKYDYPPNVRVLYEWDELGQHWMCFIR